MPPPEQPAPPTVTELAALVRARYGELGIFECGLSATRTAISANPATESAMDDLIRVAFVDELRRLLLKP